MVRVGEGIESRRRRRLDRVMVRAPLMPTLQEQFGQIDIYLFDQLLKGRIVPGMRILDAGCGSGRNLVYLLREGYEVFGADDGCRTGGASATHGADAGAIASGSEFSR